MSAVTRERVAEVLAGHGLVSRGMTYGTPDTCECGARTLPERGDEDATIRRARAFAAHLADVVMALVDEARPDGLQDADACGAVGCRALAERDEALEAREKAEFISHGIKELWKIDMRSSFERGQALGRVRALILTENPELIDEGYSVLASDLLAALDGSDPLQTREDGAGGAD